MNYDIIKLDMSCEDVGTASSWHGLLHVSTGGVLCTSEKAYVSDKDRTELNCYSLQGYSCRMVEWFLILTINFGKPSK